MRAGIPLDDAGRWPWLQLVGSELAEPRPQRTVVACSALKRSYRDAIRRVAAETTFVLLEVAPSLLEGRLLQRTGHFMPASVLASQLAALEPLQADEAGLGIPSDAGIQVPVDRIRRVVDQEAWFAKDPTREGTLVTVPR
ncbi:gluconokinase [Pseudarthrobacter sp. 1G09]|uniref:gluconokinase n=1 Tax=Pseudarthrobacter sp. 1G09 TaxID=3416178 RepID=UPI003CF667AD